MKLRLTLPLFAVTLLAASQLPLAAAPKSNGNNARVAALVAALQAVSPDPLGGRVGVEAAAERAPVPANTDDRRYAAQSPRAELDHRIYQIWKSSQKS